VPAGARDPPSIALLPSVWRSLRWCKEEWPQGLPTDPHWRHHSLRVCGRFCSNPHPCYAIRVARAKKASRFHAIGPSVAGLETLDFEHLSTWQDAVCARRCVNS
jgi:hypothetical protein